MIELISVAAPDDFNFQATIGSHGWLRLAPFSYEESPGRLTRVHQLETGETVLLRMTSGLRVEVEGMTYLTDAARLQIERDVRIMFSLDWDLKPFYQMMRQHTGYSWIEQTNAGRMLVCPSVWEDLAKTLLTTNTTWGQTKRMVAQLCALGEPHAPGFHAFPSPHRIAGLSLDMLAEQIRAGYRTAYLHQLACRIASGELDVETWRRLPSAELFKAIRNLRGFGDYAAGTMLRLLGRFDKLAIDTECRAAYKRITGSATATDAEIRDYYDRFGEWRGLVMWMNIMRD